MTGRVRGNVPTKAALFKARMRLGPGPLKALVDETAKPLASKRTKGAWYLGRRLMSIDGTCLDIADTKVNDTALGRPGSTRVDGVAAFPQIRVVALAECATHAIVEAVIGKYRDNEQHLAVGLLGSMQPDMLILADRGFFSYALWSKAHATGADLLWRTKSSHLLTPEKRLTDGSFLSKIPANTKDQRHGTNGTRVRVVEYSLGADVPESETNYRLLTTMLDHEKAPAGELAALYRERWEIESAFDELKSHQRSPRVVLRSKMPEGVIQVVYGYLCVHYAIRWLMHSVALAADTDPDRISFTRTHRVARRTRRPTRVFPPQALDDVHRQAISELLFELVASRRHRVNPRVVKRKMSNYGAKRPEHRNPGPRDHVVCVRGA